MSAEKLTGFDAGPLTRGQRRIALTAVGGYFVDGYDLLVLSGALLAITPEFSLSSAETGFLTAAAFAGMAVGSPISGPLTDRFGRKPIFFTSMVLFTVASIATLLVPSVPLLMFLRFFVGLAIGADMPPSAALISEFIPSRRRGTFTALGGVAWMLGGVCAILVTLLIYASVGDEQHWRLALASGAVPAVLLLLLRHKTPESPHWLSAHGRHDEAVAAWRYAQGAASPTPQDPEGERAPAKPPVRFDALRRRPFVLLLICICIYWGFNNLYGSALLLYQPTLITRMITPQAYTALLATAASLLLAAVLGFAICIWFIESLGRRFIALSCLSMLTISCVIIYVGIDFRILVLIAFAIAISVVNGGTSLAYYAWAPELFPTEIRGRAVGISNLVGKAGSVAGTLALPTIYDRVDTGIFLMIAAGAIVSLIVVFSLAPETKGRTLAELSRGITRFGTGMPIGVTNADNKPDQEGIHG